MSDVVLQFRGTVYEHGYGQVAQRVMRDKTIHVVAKGIYAYLVSFAGKDGNAFPGVQLMMSELGIKTKDTFYKYRDQLEDKGYITIEHQRQINGKFYKNIYNIEAVPVPKNTDHDDKENKPSTTTPITILPSTKKPDTVKTHTNNINSLKQSINTKINNNTTKETVCGDPSVIAIQESAKTALGIPLRSSEILRWLSTHDVTYIHEKINIVAKQAHEVPLRALRDAIKNDWAPEANKKLLKASVKSVDVNNRTSRVVPAAQPGKYERFYQVYGQKLK